MIRLIITGYNYEVAERCIGELAVKIEYKIAQYDRNRYCRAFEHDYEGELRERFASRTLNEADIARLLYETGIIINYEENMQG
jgi:hypothetical protein